MIASRLGCLVLFVAAGAAPAVAQSDRTFGPPVPDLRGDSLQPFEGFEGGDGARTMGAFPRNLGRGFASVFGRESLHPFLLGAAAAGASSLADTRIQDGFGGQSQGFGKVGAKAGCAPVTGP